MRSIISKTLAASVLALALVSVSGCAEVADTAKEAASGAASQVAETARVQAIKAVCAPLRDGTINAGDLKLLAGLLDSAEQAGLPAEIVDPLRTIAASGDQAPQEAQDQLVIACDDATK